MNRSDSLAKIAPSLVAALAKIEGAAKSAVNLHFRNRYANLESVIEASKDVLHEHGITLIQLPGPVVNGNLTLETILLHESGEFISGEGALPIGKQDPQGAGSALTYLRRYAQMSALNMPAVDDDGEAAHGRQDGRPRQEPQQVQQPQARSPRASAANPYEQRALDPDAEFPGVPEGNRGKTSHFARQAGDDKLFKEISAEIVTLESAAAVGAFVAGRMDTIKAFPAEWRAQLREELEAQKEIIRQQEGFRGSGAEGVAGVNSHMAEAH